MGECSDAVCTGRKTSKETLSSYFSNPPGHLLDVGKQTHEFFNYVGADQHGRKQYKLKSLEVYSHEHRTNEQPSKQYFKQTKLRDIIMEYPIAKKNPKQSDVDKGKRYQ